jgi:hypothetical protein
MDRRRKEEARYSSSCDDNDYITLLSIEQQVVSACMSIDECTVFGTIRCKSSVAKCEGVQEAVGSIQQQFDVKDGEVVTQEKIDVCAKKTVGVDKYS